MPAVDRNLLRIGTYELLWADDVPDAVAISEAVQLARDLSTEGSPAFVNGLLARLLELKPTLTLWPAAAGAPGRRARSICPTGAGAGPVGRRPWAGAGPVGVRRRRTAARGRTGAGPTGTTAPTRPPPAPPARA